MTNAVDIATPLIQHYESCRLEPYEDARGVPTIGWGNTYYQDRSLVTMNDNVLTPEAADELFVYWLNDFAQKVVAHAPSAKDNQLAAFTSLAYNIGIGAFAASTALRKFLKADLLEAGNGIELWDRAGNHVLKGLQRRRKAERLVFDGALVTHAISDAEIMFP